MPRFAEGALIALALACGCAPVGAPDAVVICDPSGCANRPRSVATFDPNASANPEADAREAGLVALAEVDPRAAYDLALRYFRGDGVILSSNQAVAWMRRSAEGGYLPAQAAMGRLYLAGFEEMGADPQAAEKWLSIAASRGDRESATLLREATAARKSQQEWWQWQTRWRPVFYGYWNTGYPYSMYWDGYSWLYY